MYVNDNWPAFRTLGVSGMNTWYYSEIFQLKDNPTRQAGRDHVRRLDEERPRTAGVPDRHRLGAPACPGRQPRLAKRPVEVSGDGGGLPLFALPRGLGGRRQADQGVAARARPAFAYIAGKPAHIFGKDHNFYPGQTVEKQIVVINDTRAPLTADCEWKVALPTPGAINST